ncbi:VWA domain-containing protein [Candidatus Poribacteria bacterium]|nr:VWA domain-containing protein [Candidatus Poribacteria bacterium]MYG07562.1 VWA domain-containing protein [Candidatus Poribacteria bacterium]MYK21855.1 VWA domain-containing protein [Candidatus Poribacteria bacterium]
MQFLNPAAFYLLGFIPIVVALHFLKLRRHTYRVPSIMLWLSTDEDRRANVPFQRLQNLLLLMLQVLFLLMVTLSAARPALHRPGFMPGRAILIVDNSASMSSTEMGQTRLALAKQAALQHIEQGAAEGGMMLMLTNATPVQVAFTTDTAKLQHAIENIPKSEASRNLQPVFDAVTHYAEAPQDKIFFISDNFENLPDISLPIHKIGVGGAAQNVGIVHFSVEIVADEYKVLVGIRNFTETPRELDVQLAVEGEPFDEKTASIAPGKMKSILFSDNPSGLEDKVISAHLQLEDDEDDFVVDNSAFALLSTVSQLRILLVSDNPKSSLPALLSTYGKHVQLHLVSPADYHGTGDAHIAIFDGGTRAGRQAFGGFSEVASGTHLVFINPGSNLPFIPEDARVVEEVTAPLRVIKTDRTHPLMVGVLMERLQVLESTYRKLPLAGRSLIETEKGTLIWLGQESSSQFLVFEFDAFNLDIPSFALTVPDGQLFFYHCLEWFEARSAPLQSFAFQEGQTRHAFRTGEHVRIAPIGEEIALHVQKPDNKTVEVVDSIFTETDQVGVYTLFADDRQLERFTVNLIDRKESALPHPGTAPAAEVPTAIAGELQTMTQEVWRIPALLACVVLLLEWWFYHRDGLSFRVGVFSKRTA